MGWWCMTFKRGVGVCAGSACCTPVSRVNFVRSFHVYLDEIQRLQTLCLMARPMRWTHGCAGCVGLYEWFDVRRRTLGSFDCYMVHFEVCSHPRSAIGAA